MLLFQCKSNVSGGIRNIKSPLVYQVVYKGGYAEAAALIEGLLDSRGFNHIDGDFYARLDGNTGISFKFEKGMSRSIYVYAGVIRDFEYIRMTRDEKTKLDAMVVEIRKRVNTDPLHRDLLQGKNISKKGDILKKGLLFSSFSLTYYDEFTTFTCDLSNKTKYQYLNLGVTINFYNTYGTIIGTGQTVINYLAPWQKKKLTFMLNVNQNIRDFDISTSNE